MGRAIAAGSEFGSGLGGPCGLPAPPSGARGPPNPLPRSLSAAMARPIPGPPGPERA